MRLRRAAAPAAWAALPPHAWHCSGRPAPHPNAAHPPRRRPWLQEDAAFASWSANLDAMIEHNLVDQHWWKGWNQFRWGPASLGSTAQPSQRAGAPEAGPRRPPAQVQTCTRHAPRPCTTAACPALPARPPCSDLTFEQFRKQVLMQQAPADADEPAGPSDAAPAASRRLQQVPEFDWRALGKVRRLHVR